MPSLFNDYLKSFNLSPFFALNPQLAMISFLDLAKEMIKHPEKIEAAQKKLFDRCVALTEYAVKKAEITDAHNGKQFSELDWEDNFVLNFIKQFYLSMSEWAFETINNVEYTDKKLHQRVNFYLKQYIDAVHPNNFPMLNPTVIKKTIEENGKNLKKGMELLLNDIKNGSIKTTDNNYFEIGKNIATTKGKIVYKNDIMELIQYEPSTESVFRIPILFIPPWINKFYILDLNPEESFVKWLVGKGFTVFMISWVNPDGRYEKIGFEDYAMDGVIASINKIHEITKETIINSIGYCIGGTLISSILSGLNDKKCVVSSKAAIRSATLLTTLLDFEHAGDLATFISEGYLELIDSQMKQCGFMDGKVMYNTFSALKANDMIWRYIINSYMLGIEPPPHSILYWNADSSNITRRMQDFLSKSLYRDNMIKLGKAYLFGVPINLKNVKQPIYMVSMIKDHLVPWEATFDGVKLFNSLVRFVVGGSGHVAGVVNPPNKNKYCYWTNEKLDYSVPSDWMKDAIEHTGSWWNDWLDWITPQSGDNVPSRPVTGLYESPGEYVKNIRPHKR